MRALFTSLLFLLALQVCAQESSSLVIQYTMNFPMGNTHDFIGKTSFRGMTLDYRYHVVPELAFGFSTGWYAFYEAKNSATYTTSNGETSYSGKQYRYINSVPLLFLADYFAKPEEEIGAFGGLGIGTTYNRVDNQMGLYDVQDYQWHFTLAPEIGVRFGGNGDFGVAGTISARYNINFTAGDLATQSYLSLNIGLMYR